MNLYSKLSLICTLSLISFSVFAGELPSGIIVGPLHQLLTFLVSYLPSVGGSIILLTLLVRISLSPLQYLSIKSMAA